jgi:uncharacterized membrane protein YqaE (UPF0057 family)
MIDIIMGLTAIAAMFGLFGEILIKIMDVFFMLFPIIPVLFDPVRLMNEIIMGVSLGFKFLFESIIDFVTPAKYLGSNNLNENKDNDDGVTVEATCYSASFLNILLLIICPPFAIWQKHGFEKLIEMLICSFLCVYLYYVPGLIYAMALVI